MQMLASLSSAAASCYACHHCCARNIVEHSPVCPVPYCCSTNQLRVTRPLAKCFSSLLALSVPLAREPSTVWEPKRRYDRPLHNYSVIHKTDAITKIAQLIPLPHIDCVPSDLTAIREEVSIIEGQGWETRPTITAMAGGLGPTQERSQAFQ